MRRQMYSGVLLICGSLSLIKQEYIIYNNLLFAEVAVISG